MQKLSFTNQWVELSVTLAKVSLLESFPCCFYLFLSIFFNAHSFSVLVVGAYMEQELRRKTEEMKWKEEELQRKEQEAAERLLPTLLTPERNEFKKKLGELAVLQVEQKRRRLMEELNKPSDHLPAYSIDVSDTAASSSITNNSLGDTAAHDSVTSTGSNTNSAELP